MRPSRHSSHSSLHQLIEQVVDSGQLSRKEHLHLSWILLTEGRISEVDRVQINRVLDYVQTGRLKLVD